MKISEIKKFAYTFNCQSNKYHESLLRAYQILEHVKHLLEIKTPQEVILDIIEEIESAKSDEFFCDDELNRLNRL